MALIPIPRSIPQIIEDQLNAFEARTGIPALKVGSPVLSIVEASAISDFRSTQDLFGTLNSLGLDRATGPSLDKLGNDDDVPRPGATFSSGFVNVGDSSFQKISSKIYAGQAAPIIGTTKLYVSDASQFPASGNVYIGRGTVNYEGPLGYSSKTQSGTFWYLTLSGGTQLFHNVNEPVIVAQGGNRVVAAGSICQTAQGSVLTAVTFATLYAVTVPDGENLITGVPVVCQVQGTTGNVAYQAINSWATKPFSTATVLNPAAISNALPTADDDTYRELIRNTRASRSLGTPLAITTGILGITSPDENKTVLSAVVVAPQGAPTTLYIDDGTGYQEQTSGVAIETLTQAANGGEQYFQVANEPVAKAIVTSTVAEPFSLFGGAILAVQVGGVLYQHTFQTTDFKTPGAATAYEVVASINSDAAIQFSARLTSSPLGNLVTIFARTDTNEAVQVLPPAVGTDANAAFGFSAGQVTTMRLYRNDLLLNKDGSTAAITSAPQGLWAASMTNPATLVLQVDSTLAFDGSAPTGSNPSYTYTFTNADFINNNTGYTTVASSNSLASWVTVFNARLAGVTASISGSSIVLTSNLGPNGRAAISILSGTLVANGMFSVTSVKGAPSDYTLNRNTGQIGLTNVLSANDTLACGTVNTRGFLQSAPITAPLTLAAGATLWFVVDGRASIISTGIVAGQTFTWSNYIATPETTWGDRVRITASSGTPFSNTLIGDWAIFWDTAIAAANLGSWRVVNVDAGSTFIDIERPEDPAWTVGGVSLTQGGITIARTLGRVQPVSFGTGGNPYTASSLASAFNAAGLRGVNAYVYKTTSVRVNTNDFDTDGDVALVAQTAAAVPIGFTTTSYVQNRNSHLGSQEAGGGSGSWEWGTPEFQITSLSSVASTTQFTTGSTAGADSGHQVRFLRPLPDPDSGLPDDRWSNAGFHSPISLISGTTFTTEQAALQEFLVNERVYMASPYAIGPDDDFAVLIDQDTQQKKYDVLMRRKVSPTTSTYGSTNLFTDTDNTGLSLGVAFGLSFNFVDFAVWMKARTKSHNESGDTNKTVLWRWFRQGPSGNNANVRYIYPSIANQPVAVTTNDAIDGNVQVYVALPSDAARTGVTVHPSTQIGVIAQNGPGSIQTLTYVLGFTVSSATRSAGTTTLTVTLPGSVANNGLVAGNKIFLASTDVNFPSGTYTLTGSTATTVSYADSGANAGPDASPGTISFDTAAATLQGSTVNTNDIASILPTGGLPAPYEQPVRITSFGNQFWVAVGIGGIAPSTTLTWYPLNQATYLSFFPVKTSGSANAITSIATAVNALQATANPTDPLTAVAVGTGADTSGVIAEASWDEFQLPSKTYQLSDGINWVQSQVNPVDTSHNYQFTFKEAVTATLATNSDWLNEDVRLVPVKAQNIVDWLNTPGVTGLGTVASIGTAGAGDDFQVATRTAGSSGSVQVQGGLANSVGASVVGSGSSIAGTYALVQVRSQDAIGIRGRMWCRLKNSAPVAKPVFTATTVINNLTVAGVAATLTLDGTSSTNFWNYANSGAAPVNGFTWQIEKWGNFVAFAWDGIGGAPSITGVQEGDYVTISGGTASASNLGTFRIVRIDGVNNVFWFENPNLVEQRATANLLFIANGSVLPGDTMVIGSSLIGTANQGAWTVSSINTGNVKQVTLNAAGRTAANFTGPVTLGTSFSLFQDFEGAPSSLIKKVQSVSPSAANGLYYDIKFTSAQGYTGIGTIAGTVISPLDKLNFSTALVQGIDGYRYSTGLIAEANRVAYGVEADSSTYPGIVAAGALVNISGPNVRRLQVSLSIEIAANTQNQQDVINRVQSVVAAVINNTGVGQSVDIAALISAARSVPGVTAVTWISPTFASGSSKIAVQPFEKPLILNLTTDVLVSLSNT
jgi:hypothetical protein